MAKMTPAEIRNMRHLWDTKQVTRISDLADIFYVSIDYARNIVNRVIWKEIEGEDDASTGGDVGRE